MVKKFEKIYELDIQDIVSGIHELKPANRRGGDIRFTVPIKTTEARHAAGTIALAGISNVNAATNMSYQLSELSFDVLQHEAQVEFKAHVGDSDGFLEKISYTIFLHS